MIKSLFKPYSYRKPVSFDCNVSTYEGVRQLSKHVKRTAIHAGLDDSLIGTVTPEKVRIWYYERTKMLEIGRFHMGMAPVFAGQFISKDGKTKLEGEFRLHNGVKAASVLCIVAIFIIFIVLAIKELNEASPASEIAMFIAAPFLTVMLLALLAKSDWKSGKENMEYIEERIKKIINI